jgi:hypothetical protein
MTCETHGNLTICRSGPWHLTRGKCLWCGVETFQLVAPAMGGWCGFDHQCGGCGIYWNDEGGVDLRSIWEDSEEGQARKRRMAVVAAVPVEAVKPYEDVIHETLRDALYP